MIGEMIRFINRSKVRINSSQKVEKNQVNMEWWDAKKNLGDYLACVVFKWIKEQKGIRDDASKRTCFLLTIGSIIGMRNYDAIIWGSGIHAVKLARNIALRKLYVKFDVRAVRGPVTKHILETCGYNCQNAVIGDPAILLPLIYDPTRGIKKYDLSIIQHVSKGNREQLENVHYINIRTHDYEKFVDEVICSKRIISSSLHGIIIAESYGIPCVFLGEGMQSEIMKFYDWYFSTGRYSVKVAMTLKEAMEMEPMPLPLLDQMRKNLMESFPSDIFIHRD